MAQIVQPENACFVSLEGTDCFSLSQSQYCADYIVFSNKGSSQNVVDIMCVCVCAHHRDDHPNTVCF